MKIIEMEPHLLKPYENNPRNNDEAVEAVANSIQAFGFKVPIIVDKDNTIIAGHTRWKAAGMLGLETVPVIKADDLTEEQVKAFRLADNKVGEAATWDFEKLDAELAELADFDMFDFGFGDKAKDDYNPFFDGERQEIDLDEESEEYQEFVKKFDDPKTTDDCYTPDNIYDAIAGYVYQKYGVKREKMKRPFYPGGDYQKEKYRTGEAVVDNPPFSILSKIIDFYIENNVQFFLFAPMVSAFHYFTRNVQIIICGASITYENKAKVNTAFITNMNGDNVAVRTDSELFRIIDTINQENEAKLHANLPKYEYPVEVLTVAKLNYIAIHGQDLQIRRESAVPIVRIDDMPKEKAIFGGGLLLSEKAAAEKAAAEKAAAEKAAAEKAAAEKAAALRFKLSDLEKAIVSSLK